MNSTPRTFNPFFSAVAGLSLIFGILVLLWHLTPDSYLVYVSNLTPSWPTDITFLNNSPLAEYLLIFSGIISIGLTASGKRKSGYLFALLSLGMLLTFAASGFPLAGPIGGFPMPWWWTTLGSCAFCRHPYFIMLFPFLIDWAIWTGLTAALVSVPLWLYAQSSRLKTQQTNSA